MKAWHLLQHIKAHSGLPFSTEHPCTETSNSELKRWFEKSAIIIDGVAVQKDAEIRMPVKELIFFPNGRRRVTMGNFFECECC